MPDKITKFINRLDRKTRESIKMKLKQLRENPYGDFDIKKMQNREARAYRLRIGKIRIIYTILNSEVEIIDIDFRGNIY